MDVASGLPGPKTIAGDFDATGVCCSILPATKCLLAFLERRLEPKCNRFSNEPKFSLLDIYDRVIHTSIRLLRQGILDVIIHPLAVH